MFQGAQCVPGTADVPLSVSDPCPGNNMFAVEKNPLILARAERGAVSL